MDKLCVSLVRWTYFPPKHNGLYSKIGQKPKLTIESDCLSTPVWRSYVYIYIYIIYIYTHIMFVIFFLHVFERKTHQPPDHIISSCSACKAKLHFQSSWEGPSTSPSTLLDGTFHMGVSSNGVSPSHHVCFSYNTNMVQLVSFCLMLDDLGYRGLDTSIADLDITCWSGSDDGFRRCCGMTGWWLGHFLHHV